VELKEYEEMCQECKGEGWIILIKGEFCGIKIPCMKCKCKGKTDWIDKIKKSGE